MCAFLQKTQIAAKYDREVSHRALGQSRDDISQSRKRLVDVFSLIKNGSCRSGLTDLE